MANQDMSIEQVRSEANKIVERAKSDPQFKQQLLDNPEKTLQAAGFPSQAIGDFARELTPNPDVTGYTACASSSACGGITVIIGLTVFCFPPGTA